MSSKTHLIFDIFTLVQFRQLGIDRVVDLQFGDGEAAHHLILEMYETKFIMFYQLKNMLLTITYILEGMIGVTLFSPILTSRFSIF